MISGYYHLVDRQTIQSNIQLSQFNSADINKLSNGQLKLTLTVDKSLSHLRQSQEFTEAIQMSKQIQSMETFGGKKSLEFGTLKDD
jgi:hypothetical protein